MKKPFAYYALSLLLIAATIASCNTKKNPDVLPGHSDSISVSKVQPSIDSISVKQGPTIDSISGKAQ